MKRKNCDKCGAAVEQALDRYCGAQVCDECGHHQGMCRCFCGWSTSGRDGRAELQEFGEVIGDEYGEY